jgi:hypothetical protein
LWEKLKDKVYINNLHIPDELKNNIQVETSHITREELHVAGTLSEGARHACKQRVTTS